MEKEFDDIPDAILKKKILDQVLNVLREEDQELYYTDTSSISHIIKDYIEDNNLLREEFELVKDLSPNDILILISYNSRA